jgi:prophage antirepressor-like protein
MQALEQFEFRTRLLRVEADDKGNPWFLAKDVCDVLGYVNSRDAVKKHCKDSGVANRYIPSLSNNYTFLSEGNMYRLIVRSNKPEAEAFESWVCDEVLPSIRKTGAYVLPGVEQQRRLERLESDVVQLLPKALAFDKLDAQPGSVCIADAAKILGVN